MADNEVASIPWAGIVKRTLQASALVAGVLTLLAASEVKRRNHENEDSQRIRWTDSNRWE